MSRRKGEISTAMIDREWPHQVALPAALCTYENHRVLIEWCAGRSQGPRRRQVRVKWEDRREEDWLLHCFSDEADVTAVMAAFGGTRFDPRVDRSRGRTGAWLIKGPQRPIVRSGPLKLPKLMEDDHDFPPGRTVDLDVPWPDDFMVKVDGR